MEGNNNIHKSMYLGLLVVDPIEKIHDIITKGLEGILSTYPEEDAEGIIKSISSGMDNPKWRYTKPDKKWHITTLFKKGKTFSTSHPAYTSFETGKNVTVNIRGMIYIPEKIITCICFPDTPVENKFPHMTTLLGEYSAKHSNDVLTSLFDEGCVYECEYEGLFKDLTNEDSFLERCEKTFLKKPETCYVYKFVEPISVETIMHAFSN
jgi:hypothetical protein